ncbi:MAG: HD domain-containing protein [Kiritimatiellae bacterium]|nr:HD domain-containing protein [Kiritimatiellia bacterium]
MTRKELAELGNAFDRYVAGFRQDGKGLHPFLRLKADHSRRVAGEARALSADLAWPAARRHAAEALGLLHDIGRFSQFTETNSFSDSSAVDHGERGWAVVSHARWLRGLRTAERHAILDGIRYHNRRVIPEDVPARSLPLLRMVRDADKLDIFRVVLDAVERDGFRDLSRMLPGVRPRRLVSARLIREMETRRSCSLPAVRSLGDLLLMQLSWVYDLNYAPALRRVADRNILARILHRLDGDPRLQRLGRNARRYVTARLNDRPDRNSA